jgi:uncharacterized protein (DUF305 family)
MKLFFTATLAISILVSAAPAYAQMMPQAKPAPVLTATPPPPDTPSTAALMEANDKMHRAMEIRYSGNPSLDFVSAMIPHHRGAIEMAQIALRYSTDRQTRRLAQKIIATGEAEIVQMTAIARRLQR